MDHRYYVDLHIAQYQRIKGMIYRIGPDFWFLDPSTLLTQLTRFHEPSLVKTFDIAPDGRKIVFDRLRRNSDTYLIDSLAKP